MTLLHHADRLGPTAESNALMWWKSCQTAGLVASVVWLSRHFGRFIDVHRCGGVNTWGQFNMDSLWWDILLRWMIWRYPYFRKPPFSNSWIHFEEAKGCVFWCQHRLVFDFLTHGVSIDFLVSPLVDMRFHVNCTSISDLEKAGLRDPSEKQLGFPLARMWQLLLWLDGWRVPFLWLFLKRIARPVYQQHMSTHCE